MHRHIAFGLRWDSDIVLGQFNRAPDDDAPGDIVVRRAAAPLPDREIVHAKDGVGLKERAVLYTDGFRLQVSEAIFDFHTPGTIEWLPGPAWRGEFPPLFFGTIAALALAWRGGIPIHGSSVEIDGRAYLVCGPSGAGKSTLAATLVASGRARLIADDLSIIEGAVGGAPSLYPGRPAIRLFPALAEHMRASGAEVREDPGNDKLLVRPARADPLIPVPLAAIIVLGADTSAIPLWRRADFLNAQVFRPLWMRAIPGWHDRFRFLHHVGTTVPMHSLGAADIRDTKDFHDRALQALALVDSGTGVAER